MSWALIRQSARCRGAVVPVTEPQQAGSRSELLAERLCEFGRTREERRVSARQLERRHTELCLRGPPGPFRADQAVLGAELDAGDFGRPTSAVMG